MEPTLRNRAAAAFAALLVAIAGGWGYIKWNEPHTYAEGGFNATPAHEPTWCWQGVVQGPPEAFKTLGIEVPDGGVLLALAESCFYLDPRCEDPKAKVMVDPAKTEEALPPEPAKLATSEDVAWTALVASAKSKTPIEVKPEPKAEPKPEPAPDPKAPDGGVLPKPEPVLTDLCLTHQKALPGAIEWTTADERIVPYVKGNPIFRLWLVGHPDAPWACSCPDAKGKPVRMPCGCWTANCAIPEACKVDPCRDGKWVCGDDPYGGSCGVCKDGLECVGHACVPPAGPDAGSADDAGQG
jgi:hypothetical protein